jgi:hypothetical protein
MEACCNWLTKFCTSSVLFICNFVDLIAGCGLCLYAGFLGLHHYAPSWMYGMAGGLGGLLIFTSLVSFCGIYSSACTGCLSFSSCLAFPTLLWEVALAVVALTKAKVLEAYLHQHQTQLQLTAAEIEEVQAKHKILSYLLFGLAGMELLRILSSKGLKSVMNSEVQQAEYQKIEIPKRDEDENSARGEHPPMHGRGPRPPAPTPQMAPAAGGGGGGGDGGFYATYGS